MSIIICDTREKNNKRILKYFEKVNQDYIVSKLDAGDYMIYKNPKIIIDKKNGLLELSRNLCRTTEHERIKREIERAKKMGCEDFIFLIQDSKLKSIDDIIEWESPRTKVKGATLYKIMKTMKQKYDVRFVIVPQKDMGGAIIKLLNAE